MTKHTTPKPLSTTIGGLSPDQLTQSQVPRVTKPTLDQDEGPFKRHVQTRLDEENSTQDSPDENISTA